MAMTYLQVTPAGAGNKSGSSWDNAMGESEFETNLEGSAATDYVYFLKAGTYTMNSAYDSSARGGSGQGMISIIGVKAATTNEGANVVYSDWGSGTDRPFFDATSYAFRIGNYYSVRNIYIQGTAAAMFQCGSGCVIENCKFDNNYGTSSNRYAVTAAQNCMIINCEIMSIKSRGINITSTGARVIHCYFHDIPDDGSGGIAINNASNGLTVLFCFFSNIKFNAILVGGATACIIMNNTFYTCGTDVSGTSGLSNVFINNLHEGTTANAYIYTTQTNGNFYWNNWGNDARCTDMWSGVDITTNCQDYPNAAGLYGDPSFSSAGSSAALGAGSSCLNNGMSLTLGV